MRQCNNCKSTSLEIAFPGNNELWSFEATRYEYLVCRSCGLLISSPTPDAVTSARIYEQFYNYSVFSWLSSLKRFQTKSRLRALETYIAPGSKVLDFGCGHGYFVERLASEGYRAHGFDIGASKIVQRDRASITYGASVDDLKETNFDAITLWHVFEHVLDPLQTLEKLYGLLAPGGHLLIAVPNSSSLGFRICKEKWGWCQQPFVHTFHYNSSNLQGLMSQSGFRPIDSYTTDTWDGNIYDIITQQILFRNKPRGTANLNFDSKFSPVLLADATLRLLCTPISYALSAIVYDRSKDGAQLLVVGQKA